MAKPVKPNMIIPVVVFILYSIIFSTDWLKIIPKTTPLAGNKN